MPNYFLRVLLVFDNALNVIFSPILNQFVKKGGALFGSPDEHLSSVFGKNQKTNTCKLCTWLCIHVLNRIDENHCAKSIEMDEGARK